MCGIAGWFSPTVVEQDSTHLVERMVNAIAHRGPDGQGIIITEHAALGHVRLAIIDLTSGKQPISLQNKYHIIFNGEIYNYQELRANLIQRGHQFKTQSDTEVILASYIEWGQRAFSLLRGMFTVAIWDGAKQCGLLVRDTIGIKPLFYSHTADGELVFGSEAKAILARAEKNTAKLNENALHLLMNFRYLPGNLSLFRGIHQLEPGTILHWSVAGSIRMHPFAYQQDRSPTSVFSEFETSCKYHLTSDVEVGVYLSGGIDSAGITALAARHSAHRLRTFTLNIGDDPDEALNAARSAEIMDVENLQGEMLDPVGDYLSDLVWHLEVPKVNSIQVRRIAQLASKHVKVVLSGLGGDELFLGYNAHRIMLQAGRMDHLLPSVIMQSLPAIARRGLAFTRLPFWSEPERAMLMLEALGDWPRVYGLLRNVWDSPGLRRKVYGPRMLDSRLDHGFDHIRQQWPSETDPVIAMAGFEWRNKMVNDLLWQEDRCSMAVGLEVRVPYLDPALARAVQNVPRRELMIKGRPKAYMRSMLKALLPEEIMSRPKSGFQLDASTFFNTELKPLADYWLSHEKVIEMQLFNPEFVTTVRKFPTGKMVRWHYFMLYLMLMTHLWIDVFEKGNRP